MHGHIKSAEALQTTCIFLPYVFILCVIVFVLAVAGGPENVWAAARKYFGPRDLLQTMLTSFFFPKKVGVVLRIHQHCTAAFSLNITNVAVFSCNHHHFYMQKGPARHSGEPQGARGGDGEV